jgi:hypothetical protein
MGPRCTSGSPAARSKTDSGTGAISRSSSKTTGAGVRTPAACAAGTARVSVSDSFGVRLRDLQDKVVPQCVDRVHDTRRAQHSDIFEAGPEFVSVHQHGDLRSRQCGERDLVKARASGAMSQRRSPRVEVTAHTSWASTVRSGLCLHWAHPWTSSTGASHGPMASGRHPTRSWGGAINLVRLSLAEAERLHAAQRATAEQRASFQTFAAQHGLNVRSLDVGLAPGTPRAL